MSLTWLVFSVSMHNEATCHKSVWTFFPLMIKNITDIVNRSKLVSNEENLRFFSNVVFVCGHFGVVRSSRKLVGYQHKRTLVIVWCVLSSYLANSPHTQYSWR